MPILPILLIGAFIVVLVGQIGEYLFMDSIVNSDGGKKGYWITLLIIYVVISIPPAMLMNRPDRMLAFESFMSEAVMSVLKVLQWVSIGYLIGFGIYLQSVL